MAKCMEKVIRDIDFNRTPREIKIIFEGPLSKNKIGDFAKSMEKNVSIKHICLVIKEMTTDESKILFSCLSNNEYLESLKIVGTVIDDVSIGYLAIMIKNNKKIKTLDISDCTISERAAIAIGFVLGDNKTIHTLKIGKNEDSQIMKENHVRYDSWCGWKSMYIC
jgi:molybdenum cofactor biosynthesis enzyme